jgi:hypothetical protein
MTEATKNTRIESDTKAGVGNRPAWYQRYSIVLFLVFVLLETLIRRPSFLWKIQELDLFVFNHSYLIDTFQHIGGLTRYIASFLTQFFYYPWLGFLLYATLLTVVSWLVVTGFNLKKHLRPFSFIPALAVLLTATELGYEVVGLNVQGYVFVVPIGLMALLSGFLWYRRLPNNIIRSGFLFGWTLLAYPLVGVYALMSTVLMLLFSLRTRSQQKDKWTWMLLLIGLASLVMLPLLINNTMYSMEASSNVYTALLPDFPSEKVYLWLPYIVLTLSLLIMTLSFPLSTVTESSPFQRQSSLILFGATLMMVYVCGNRDNAFHTELAMERSFSSDEWQEVLKLSQKMGNTLTESTASYTELSRYNLGLMAKPTHVSASPFSGGLVSYEYGDAPQSLRWCLEQAASYGMNVHVLKYLTRSARATGNNALASKYNQPLKGTLFHRKWALEQAYLIEQSIKYTSTP